MFTLTIVRSDGKPESVTQHATATEAVREFDGWRDATLRYTIEGQCSVKAARMLVLASRNRVLQMSLSCSRTAEGESEVGFSVPTPVALKAPQIDMLLQALCSDADTVDLQITNTELVVY